MQTQETYTVEYFIRKFSAIPEAMWRTLNVGEEGGRRCAMGHCGLVYDAIDQLQESFDEERFKEAAALGKLLMPVSGCIKTYTSVYKINDKAVQKYDQPTPKERILAALHDIKKLNDEQKAQASVATVVDSSTEDCYKNITRELAILPQEEVSDVKIKEAV